jgi:acetyl esterase/lipase
MNIVLHPAPSAATPDALAFRTGAAVGGDRDSFPLRHVPYGNDPRQRLDVYLPQDRRVASTIVFFYGGGWVSGARWYYRLLGKALAKRGHVVIIPDYRLFPQVRFPDFNQDAALALSWANQNLLRLGGHPSRLFLMGHSAGAHIAATLALDPRYLASHSMVPGQIAGVIGLAGPYTLNPLKWQGVREIFSPSADEPQAARPIKLVRAGAPPMLLLHGARDRLVGAHASVLMSEALLRAGSHASAEIYKGLGHTGILTSLMPGLRWRSPALKHAEAFLARPAGPLPDDRS